MFEYFHNFFYDAYTFVSFAGYFCMLIIFPQIIAMSIIAFIIRKIQKECDDV
jgi:uncharacterized membrane protein